MPLTAFDMGIVGAFCPPSPRIKSHERSATPTHQRLVQLEIIPPTPRDFVAVLRLDPPWAVICGVSAERRDLCTTARHMNP